MACCFSKPLCSFHRTLSHAVLFIIHAPRAKLRINISLLCRLSKCCIASTWLLVLPVQSWLFTKLTAKLNCQSQSPLGFRLSGPRNRFHVALSHSSTFL
jgi:hypothetical protein